MEFFCRDLRATVYGIAQNVKHAAQRAFTNRNTNPFATGFYLHPPRQVVAFGKHNATDGIFAYMLHDFHDSFSSVNGYRKRLSDLWQLFTMFKANVHNRA